MRCGQEATGALPLVLRYIDQSDLCIVTVVSNRINGKRNVYLPCVQSDSLSPPADSFMEPSLSALSPSTQLVNPWPMGGRFAAPP